MNNEKSVLAQTFLTLRKNLDEEIDEAKKHNTQKYDRKRKLIRDDCEMIGKYGMPFIKKQNIELDTIDLHSYKWTDRHN